MNEERLGKDHTDVAILMTNLVANHNCQSHFEIAIQLLQTALTIEKRGEKKTAKFLILCLNLHMFTKTWGIIECNKKY